MVSIPDDVFDKYRSFADDMISSNFGVNCQLILPSKKESCPNCTTNFIGGTSTNVYKSGGPAPFNFGLCPMCGGNGFSETPQTETIKMRVYWNEKDWKKVATVLVPNADCMTIGFLTDLPTIKRAQHVIMNTDKQAIEKWTFKLKGDPQPHGFKLDRYFAAFWERA